MVDLDNPLNPRGTPDYLVGGGGGGGVPEWLPEEAQHHADFLNAHYWIDGAEATQAEFITLAGTAVIDAGGLTAIVGAVIAEAVATALGSVGTLALSYSATGGIFFYGANNFYGTGGSTTHIDVADYTGPDALAFTVSPGNQKLVVALSPTAYTASADGQAATTGIFGSPHPLSSITTVQLNTYSPEGRVTAFTWYPTAKSGAEVQTLSALA